MKNKNSIARSIYKRKYIIRHEILHAFQKYQDHVYKLVAPMEQLYALDLVLDIKEIVVRT